MNIGSSFGILASILIVISILPQIYKVYKIKAADELSFVWLFLGLLGAFFWILYALYAKDNILLSANIIMFLNFMLLGSLKFRYDKINKRGKNER